MEENKTKICTQCGLEKPLTEYYKRLNSPDGYSGVCTICRKEKTRVRRSVREPVSVEKKVCIDCFKELSISEFCKCNQNKDGHQGVCKSCRKIRIVKYKSKYIQARGKPPFIIEQKECSKCHLVKPISEFHKKLGTTSGISSRCKICVAEYQVKYYSEKKDIISEKGRGYREVHKEEIAERNRINRNAPQYKLKKSETDRLYREAHKEELKIKNKEYSLSAEGKAKSKDRGTKYRKDPVFKLKTNLRNRLLQAIKKGFKVGSAVRDLGCSVEEAKEHLECQFLPGMSWGNYGKRGWHIDHVIPLDAFDLTKYEDVVVACNYRNLQPLWAYDNLIKRVSYDPADLEALRATVMASRGEQQLLEGSKG